MSYWNQYLIAGEPFTSVTPVGWTHLVYRHSFCFFVFVMTLLWLCSFSSGAGLSPISSRGLERYCSCVYMCVLCTDSLVQHVCLMFFYPLVQQTTSRIGGRRRCAQCAVCEKVMYHNKESMVPMVQYKPQSKPRYIA